MERLGFCDSRFVKLRINGDEMEVSDASNVRELVLALSLPPQTTLVEQNGIALRRDEWEQSLLREGDRFELIQIVAGG